MNYDKIFNDKRMELIAFSLSRGLRLSDAEDVVSDLYIKLKISMDSGMYREEGKYFGWVMTSLNNLIMDFHRQNARQKKNAVIDYDVEQLWFISDSKKNAQEILESEEEIKQLLSDVLTLHKSQIKIIELRALKGMSFKDIAKDLGISINTALGQYRYAIKNLKKIWKK